MTLSLSTGRWAQPRNGALPEFGRSLCHVIKPATGVAEFSGALPPFYPFR
jgi:hypothetical protein